MQIIAMFFTAIAIGAVFSFIFSLPVMLLWDWLMPVIFGLPTITWLQAWGLSILCSLLFKSHESTKNK